MINGLNEDVFQQALRVLAWSNAATTLLVHPKTGSVRLEVGDIPRDAYGVAIHATLIRVNAALLDDPVRMALVIVHELTHCIDYDEVGSALRDGGRGWASEINAHFNQGLVMRELDFGLPEVFVARTALEAMARSNTTFGNSMDWRTRDQVVPGIKLAYADHRRRSDTTHTTDDARWEKPGGLHYFPSKVDAY